MLAMLRALLLCAVVTPGRAARVASVVMAQPRVELARFFPTLPVVDPEAEPASVFQLSGGASARSLTWSPDDAALSLLSNGAPLGWTIDGGLVQQPTQLRALSHAALGAELVTCTADGVYLSDPSTGGAKLLAAATATAPYAACRVVVLSERRLLLISADSSGGWAAHTLSADGGAAVRLGASRAAGPVRGACVSGDERYLYVAAGDEVLRTELEPDGGAWVGGPAPLFSTAPDGPAGEMATDVQVSSPALPAPRPPPSQDTRAMASRRAQGNLYVCTSRGVAVHDADGELLLTLAMGGPAASICFGGGALNTLYVADPAGEVYAATTSVRGAIAMSEAQRQFIEKQACVGTFRHDGW